MTSIHDENNETDGRPTGLATTRKVGTRPVFSAHPFWSPKRFSFINSIFNSDTATTRRMERRISFPFPLSCSLRRRGDRSTSSGSSVCLETGGSFVCFVVLFVVSGEGKASLTEKKKKSCEEECLGPSPDEQNA